MDIIIFVYWETCPEIWPKSFKNKRSYNISKHLVKKRRLLFLAPWTLNLRILGIFENESCSSRWEKSNGVYPIEIGLTVLEISGGGAESAPHQSTSSRNPISNRVNINGCFMKRKYALPFRRANAFSSLIKHFLRIVVLVLLWMNKRTWWRKKTILFNNVTTTILLRFNRLVKL